MRSRSITRRTLVVLIPIFGTVLFILLYGIASVMYPGGSQLDKHSIGFSWVNNYWCNLLNADAINGQPNPAQPIAIASMFILLITLIFFWFLFARFMNISNPLKLVMKISGVISIAIACFLTSINHDLVINLSSAFGLLAMLCVFIGLYRERQMKRFVLGLVAILLVPVNNFFYYHVELIRYLPMIQKMTFAIFLFWICWIDWYLFKKAQRTT